MVYPTRRAIFLVALGIPLSLVSALFVPHLWLSGVVWALGAVVLFLFDIALAAVLSRFTLDLHLPNAIAVGTTGEAAAALNFSGRTPGRAEFALDTGPLLRAAPPQQTARARKKTITAEFALTPVRRGTGLLERLWIRWQGPLGLSWRQRIESLGQPVPIIPNIQAVKEEAAQIFQRETPLGAHLRLDLGGGSEFHALRPFETGMSRRTIDWKQSARHGALIAKEFQAENNLRIMFALDTGRVMCEPLDGQPRLDRALHSALLLAYAGLRMGDRVGLFAFDERPVLNSGMISGTAAFSQLQRLAAKVDYSDAETNFTLAFTQLAGVLEHRSIVVVFTDFADTIGAELMLENVGRLLKRHIVLFVVFRDEELETMVRKEPRSPEDVSRAVIAHAMLRERERVTSRLERMGVRIVDAPADAIGMRLLRAYLEIKRSERF
ncbi:MAG TPA: DUF58 domain-containing protein [Rhizomicrobium sp.]|nr:DUF58 domain-containing protein [Rhizomicrobium sp.]